jgi:predicted RNA binding protein YcfA (HicA-like mRNA interferase family)
MTKRDKLIQKILKGNSVVTIEEAEKILLFLAYIVEQPDSGSSHITYRKENCNSITLVLTQKELKQYLIRKIQDALRKAGY